MHLTIEACKAFGYLECTLDQIALYGSSGYPVSLLFKLPLLASDVPLSIYLYTALRRHPVIQLKMEDSIIAVEMNLLFQDAIANKNLKFVVISDALCHRAVGLSSPGAIEKLRSFLPILQCIAQGGYRGIGNLNLTTKCKIEYKKLHHITNTLLAYGLIDKRMENREKKNISVIYLMRYVPQLNKAAIQEARLNDMIAIIEEELSRTQGPVVVADVLRDFRLVKHESTRLRAFIASKDSRSFELFKGAALGSSGVPRIMFCARYKDSSSSIETQVPYPYTGAIMDAHLSQQAFELITYKGKEGICAPEIAKTLGLETTKSAYRLSKYFVAKYAGVSSHQVRIGKNIVHKLVVTRDTTEVMDVRAVEKIVHNVTKRNVDLAGQERYQALQEIVKKHQLISIAHLCRALTVAEGLSTAICRKTVSKLTTKLETEGFLYCVSIAIPNKPPMQAVALVDVEMTTELLEEFENQNKRGKMESTAHISIVEDEGKKLERITRFSEKRSMQHKMSNALRAQSSTLGYSYGMVARARVLHDWIWTKAFELDTRILSVDQVLSQMLLQSHIQMFPFRGIMTETEMNLLIDGIRKELTVESFMEKLKDEETKASFSVKLTEGVKKMLEKRLFPLEEMECVCLERARESRDIEKIILISSICIRVEKQTIGEEQEDVNFASLYQHDSLLQTLPQMPLHHEITSLKDIQSFWTVLETLVFSVRDAEASEKFPNVLMECGGVTTSSPRTPDLDYPGWVVGKKEWTVTTIPTPLVKIDGEENSTEISGNQERSPPVPEEMEEEQPEEEPVLPTKIRHRVRRLRTAIWANGDQKWTATEDETILSQYMTDRKAGYVHKVPLELQETKEEELACVDDDFGSSVVSWAIMEKRLPGRLIRDLRVRLKSLLEDPWTLVRIERCVSDDISSAYADCQVMKTLELERQEDPTFGLLITRLGQILLTHDHHYYTLAAEQLLSSFSTDRVKRGLRYLVGKGWVIKGNLKRKRGANQDPVPRTRKLQRCNQKGYHIARRVKLYWKVGYMSIPISLYEEAYENVTSFVELRRGEKVPADDIETPGRMCSLLTLAASESLELRPVMDKEAETWSYEVTAGEGSEMYYFPDEAFGNARIISSQCSCPAMDEESLSQLSLVLDWIHTSGEKGVSLADLHLQLKSRNIENVCVHCIVNEICHLNRLKVVDGYGSLRIISSCQNSSNKLYSMHPYSIEKDAATIVLKVNATEDVHIRPWIELNGTPNFEFLANVKTKYLHLILESPGIKECELISAVVLLSPQDARCILSMLSGIDEVLYVRIQKKNKRTLFSNEQVHPVLRIETIEMLKTVDRETFFVYYFPTLGAIQQFGSYLDEMEK